MSTALATQLAQIAAKKSNPLDLKAQRKAHSQSLIFEQSVAATQDFDTIYQLCLEGFQDLCQLDKRFLPFSRGIFSEQSKREERTQMTTAQNKELDEAIESFLGLVGARLLLKPALKAVEWLVRRFRVHENNTVCMIITFLPYHTMSVFATLLSIIPRNLPSELKFLHPYIESLACPPRQTIVYTAINNRDFFTALNGYILKISRAGQQYRSLMSYWAMVATEAITGQLDQAGSGRKEAQIQKAEDTLYRILPFLNEGLALRRVPDLRIGCYMILTALASRIALEDKVLDAMMEAIASNWTQETTQAGLICLAVLAQRKQSSKLPKKVFNAIMLLDNLLDDLLVLNNGYQVDKLTLCLILGILKRLGKNQDAYRLTFIRTAIEGGLMGDEDVAVAITATLETAHDKEISQQNGWDVQGQLADLVLRLADSKTVGTITQDTIRNIEMNIEDLEIRLQTVLLRPDVDISMQSIEDIDMEGTGENPSKETFDAVSSHIPIRTAYEMSFLSHSESYIYGSLSQAFLLASTSLSDLKKFTDFPVLRKSLATTEPLFISFFIRFWCGPYPGLSRAAAVSCVRDYLKEETNVSSDLQILFPYILFALGDPVAKVRHAATELVLALSSTYSKEVDGGGKLIDRDILGKDHIYGQSDDSTTLTWLSTNDAFKCINELLTPNLEEFRLDDGFISQQISETLQGSHRTKSPKFAHTELRTSFKVAILTFLSSHIKNTPLYAVKLRLISMLDEVEKVGSLSKTKVLLPLLEAQALCNAKSVKQYCENEQIDRDQLLNQIVKIVSPGDKDGIRALQNIIAPDHPSACMSLKRAVIYRIREVWTSIKPDGQLSLATSLLQHAIMASQKSSEEGIQNETIAALRAVPLSCKILQVFLENLPTISTKLKDGSPNTKRRRTSNGQVDGQPILTHKQITVALRQITLVLELIENSETGTDPQLLHGLFRVLNDIQQSKNPLGTELSYLQSLLLACLQAVAEKSIDDPKTKLDHTSIRADLIIDCIRNATDPQVQRAALLLMSNLARTVPEVIIHSVMPIFTFMGTTVLKQADDYSSFVINQTIESVIPPLVAALHKEKGGALVGVSEILLSFVAAFEHIPIHRRHGLFTSLVDKLGAEDFLFALLVMLLDRHPEHDKLRNFVKGLANHYSALTQFKTMEKYIEVVLDSLKPKPICSSRLLSFGDGRRPARTALGLMVLPPQIFRSRRLIVKVNESLARKDEEAREMRKAYSHMIEQALNLSSNVHGYSKLPGAAEQLLDALLNLFSMQESIISLKDLLENGNENIRRQVLGSFKNRIDHDSTGDQQSQRACLDFIPYLASILTSSKEPLLKLVTLSCIDTITEKFGKKDIEIIVNVTEVIAGEYCLGVADTRLQVEALQCLATATEILREAIIPIVPQAIPKAFTYLEISVREGSQDERLHNAVYSFMEAFISCVSWMLKGQFLDRLLTISHKSAKEDVSPTCNQNRTDALCLIAKHIEPNDCFSALCRTWESAVEKGPKALREHIYIFNLAIEKHPKSVIVKHAQLLLSIFLKGFDLRQGQAIVLTESLYSDKEIERTEFSVNESFIRMIYKLNDANFRPLFIRSVEWAATSNTKQEKQGKIYRQITWHAFLELFFDTLGPIVTSYASFIIDNAVENLRSTSISIPASILLWNRTISTLRSAFEHDQDEFWQSPSHFTAISQPLLAQLARAASIPALPALIPCITSLASAADSAEHHKALNAAILPYMRSDSSAVRLAAVQCELSLTAKLGEEWLSLLPEMLPFISELQEDDDERVESETGKWILMIEGVLGESLDGMLQ